MIFQVDRDFFAADKFVFRDFRRPVKGQELSALFILFLFKLRAYKFFVCFYVYLFKDFLFKIFFGELFSVESRKLFSRKKLYLFFFFYGGFEDFFTFSGACFFSVFFSIFSVSVFLAMIFLQKNSVKSALPLLRQSFR